MMVLAIAPQKGKTKLDETGSRKSTQGANERRIRNPSRRFPEFFRRWIQEFLQTASNTCCGIGPDGRSDSP
jgi:hypothetical protein